MSNRPTPGNRRGGRPPAMTDAPPPDSTDPDKIRAHYNEILDTSVPDWSEKTLALLDDLTPLERSFVEWYATGKTSADAYRLASGRTDFLDRSASTSGAQIKARPHVKLAIAAALNDRSFGARRDREWKLQQLGSLVDRYNNSTDPRDWDRIPPIIELMAKLQGEIVQRAEVKHEGLEQGRDVRVRIADIIAEVTGRRPAPLVDPAPGPVVRVLADRAPEPPPPESRGHD